MLQHQEDVLLFHKTFVLTVNDKPTIPSQKDRALRVNLICEETGELIEAVTKEVTGYAWKGIGAFMGSVSMIQSAETEVWDGIVGIADACADMLYVIYGAGLTYGLILSYDNEMVDKYDFGTKEGPNNGLPIDGAARINRKGMELCRKFSEATIKEDLAAIEAALNDLLAYTHAVARATGIDINPVFAEVQRSNMSKLWEDGTVHRRESDGKILKPPTYSPADIAGVLAKQKK